MTVGTEDNKKEPILTINPDGELQTSIEQENWVWHEIQNAYFSKRILTGRIGAVENSNIGIIAVVNYKGQRISIPVKEVIGELKENTGYGSIRDREERMLNSMLFSEIDFIIKGIDAAEKSVVASRREAMLAKRKKYYFPNERGAAMITEGKNVEARIIAVSQKAVRAEIFGAECTIPARNLAWEWIADAKEQFHIGETLVVQLTMVKTDLETGTVIVEADVKPVVKNSMLENLKKVQKQGKYAGRITDIHKGMKYVRLEMGVNALANRCTDSRQPGKNDDVTFVVTNINETTGEVKGFITRILRQHI